MSRVQTSAIWNKPLIEKQYDYIICGPSVIDYWV